MHIAGGGAPQGEAVPGCLVRLRRDGKTLVRDAISEDLPKEVRRMALAIPGGPY